MPPRESETESETGTETETSQTENSSSQSETESSQTGGDETESETSETESSETQTDSSEMYTSSSEESEIDQEEHKAQEKAKQGGVSEDAFSRRVPSSFYEKERKRFGDLPKNIETGYVGKKPYFADHQRKTTSWIDPRTEKTRVNDVMKCKMGELPYGWDEEIDPEVGVYYIDHNTQSTFLDPPWDPRVQFQVSQLQKFLAEQISIFKTKLEELDAERQSDEEKKNSEIKVLEAEKKKLLDELELLKKKNQAESSSESESETESESESGKEGSPIPNTLEEFQERLKELLKLQEVLNKSGSVDEVEEFKKTREEIENVQKLLRDEEETRNKILREILDLKGQIQETVGDFGSYNDSGSPPMVMKTMTAEEVAQAPPRKAILARKTRYEMEMELLMLQKKLRTERTSNQVLQSFASSENARDGALPNWVKSIDNMAESSRTLRVKIAQKQKENPQNLSFRERMLFFTSNAIENKTK